MSTRGPMQVVPNNLVFYYDTFNNKSYIGEPSTNLNQQVSDYTGTNYCSDTEWIYSEPTKFSKTYNSTISTPIGIGATLCVETSNTGYYHLSRMGGGSESGAHSISCYVYPNTAINNFTIGMLGDGGNMITFDLTTRTITYGGGIENRNAFISDVVGFPGWFRIGANIEGRYGGWVGCVGLNTHTSYTPSVPYKSFYITGLQYEYKTHCTPYLFGTRSNTNGLIDLTGNNTIDLTNAGYDSGANISFDGSSNYINCGTSVNLQRNFTLECWAYITGDVSSLFGQGVTAGNQGLHVLWYYQGNRGMIFGMYGNDLDTPSYVLTYNKWHHFAFTYNHSTYLKEFYADGLLVSSGIRTEYAGSGQFNVGGSYSAGSLPAKGKIASAAVYSKILTASEILGNFNRTKTRFGF